MNRFTAFLAKPIPNAKVWHAIWLLALGLFYGAWVQAVDTAEAIGSGLSLKSHVIFLLPVWAMLVGAVASGTQWRRTKSGVAG